MKLNVHHFFGLTALSSAVIYFSSGNIIATSSADVSSRTLSDSSSIGCVTEYIADGYCDQFNNNENCGGYDGGDCCECTCVSTESYQCGAGYRGGYSCTDPSAQCGGHEKGDHPDRSRTHSISYSVNSSGCVPGYIADGYCDQINNNKECGFDGGDCCECTSVSSDLFIWGEDSTYHRGFACLDPSAPCHNHDGFDTEEDNSTAFDDDDTPDSGFHSLCLDAVSGNGNCDADNNVDECGYDGGDCCECDCVSTGEFTCGGNRNYDCIDSSSSCVGGYVLAGTKTTIGVSANAFDTRPGGASGDGCGGDGCSPDRSIDGIIHDIASRWSCEQGFVSDGQPCQIEFVFDDPQDIMEVQVAFWKGEERSRTLEVAINGEVIGDFASYPGSTFNALGIRGVGVNAFSLKHVDVDDAGGIGLMEVRFLVEP